MVDWLLTFQHLDHTCALLVLLQAKNLISGFADPFFGRPCGSAIALYSLNSAGRPTFLSNPLPLCSSYYAVSNSSECPHSLDPWCNAGFLWRSSQSTSPHHSALGWWGATSYHFRQHICLVIQQLVRGARTALIWLRSGKSVVPTPNPLAWGWNDGVSIVLDYNVLPCPDSNSRTDGMSWGPSRTWHTLVAFFTTITANFMAVRRARCTSFLLSFRLPTLTWHEGILVLPSKRIWFEWWWSQSSHPLGTNNEVDCCQLP